VKELIAAGVPVRYGHQAGIMHDKFTIRDGAELETGSFNYTNHASLANQENQIYLADPEVLERYRARFEKMWASATEPAKKGR
jgi:phosphatidylserine/phosphatidylglycerophosphate/cardiolipin synthase-like enzyme